MEPRPKYRCQMHASIFHSMSAHRKNPPLTTANSWTTPCHIPPVLSKSLAGGHWSGFPWLPGPCISRKEQCFLQSHIQSRIWKPPRRNPRAARSEASAPRPEVRHPAAPKRMERGWGAEECLTQSPPSPPRECGGVREGRTHAEARRRGGLGGGGFCTKGQKGNKGAAGERDGWSTLKTMKTASRTWKGRGDVDGRSNWAKGEQVKWEARRFFLFGWGALG